MGVAIALYFLFRPYVGLETLSWIVILAAAPFGALGFFSYHGMSAGRFLRVWFRSEILEPAHLRVLPTNLYYEALKGVIEAHEKEVYKRHDKDSQ